MRLSLSRVATIATVSAAVLAGAIALTSRSASAGEITSEITTAISTSQFVALFGSPAPYTGQNTLACGLGEVRLFAGPIPTSFLPADGRLLLINENPALFTGLSTMFGGDGRTTFGLPNLKAVTPNGLTYAVCVSDLTFIGSR